MTRLEITGPGTVAPGSTAQFTATTHMSDGTARDVTASAQWRSNTVDLRLSTPGLVTAQRLGEGVLSAAFGGRISTREVIMVPDGTYRLMGTVADPVAPAGPVAMARIDVTEGTGRGFWTFTGDDGRYRLFGVAGDIEVRVIKDRYRPFTFRVTVTDHQTKNIDLEIIEPIPDVSGSYTLTIAAADVCGTSLPEEAMSRTYSAAIRQVGPTIGVVLGDARFGQINGWTPNSFEGAVEPKLVRLSLGTLGCFGYYYGCGPSLLEELGPSRFFLPTGSVTLGISPTTLAGELDGTIEVHTGSQGQFSLAASCRSYRHQFTFSR